MLVRTQKGKTGYHGSKANGVSSRWDVKGNIRIRAVINDMCN